MQPLLRVQAIDLARDEWWPKRIEQSGFTEMTGQGATLERLSQINNLRRDLRRYRTPEHSCATIYNEGVNVTARPHFDLIHPA
tara:strand:- start:35342 stop:35590 length:249 start_codon:yes stop_codon:yes gene_type:complete